MLTIRRSDEIYHAQGGWFEARWHFSFDHYRHPRQMGVGALRVFNDDRIVAGAEWPMHPHRDIESLTYVVEGDFVHADSLGNNGHLRSGAAQVMTFSSEGDLHSERNGSTENPMRFIQFWIIPSTPGLETRVQQRQFEEADRAGRWLQIMSPPGEEGLDLAQDARVLVARLTPDASLRHEWPPGRGGYLYVIDGSLSVDSQTLGQGDAVKVSSGPESIVLTTGDEAELILVDTVLDFEPIGVGRFVSPKPTGVDVFPALRYLTAYDLQRTKGSR